MMYVYFSLLAPNRHDNDNEGPHLQHQPIPNPKPPRRVEAATAAGTRDKSRLEPEVCFFLSFHLLRYSLDIAYVPYLHCILVTFKTLFIYLNIP